ncbi:restriction endonuclease subunit S [Vibrio hepatarius]|jgi:type I restriction enzyme S subunit|uniref:Type I restriction modification DNA specificity domain-containing protein n=1 Tax=Vibrio hepatarius TaxID=171383 RepID=A0A0M0I3V4_9VIBR|nr:restriction endonuclease subunit S [Vibrio hepatarius]KOO08995.1 hypothetical protein AKJ31_01110 [Vibrio hepatarius]
MSCNQTLTVGDIAQVFDGPHATPKKIEAGPYFLSISSLENGKLDLSKSAHVSDEDFKKWTRRVKPEEGDILFSYETRLGEVAMMPAGVTACLGRRMGLLRPDRTKILPEYLLYAYQSPAFQETIRSKTIHGATVDRIALKELPSFPIQVPPILEQEKIVNVLKGYDRKLILNAETNKTLEQMAQAIFKSWFVEFDPVKAKMNGELPEGMDAATALLFPEKLVESELGLIPEGWEVGALSSVVDVIMGQSPKGSTYNDQNEGTPLVNGPVEFGVYHPVAQKWTTAPTKMSKNKDLIVCVRGSTTGRYVVSDGEYCLGRGVCSIRSNDFPSFANYLFKSELNSLLHLTTGSTFPSWSGPTLKNFKVVVPPETIIEKFELLIGKLCEMMARNTGQNETLSTLRDTLLPKLLSGEIELGQAQELAEVE